MTTDIARLTATLADRYVIQRELGAGGMATVYLAHDVKHDRDVAVKVLRPELAAVIGAERFLAEIKTTANLQHPHILPLFDSGEADGLLFYVMPFVQGISLRERLTREKQLPVADAVRIATEVAAALDYAHRHGVIHRDIKPENIMLHDGSALVADFGIALAASKAGARMTETGMSLGTPQYMSPEQAMGERELDARSDVYALGCVTYEMLIGEPPFTGPTAQAIIARLMTEEPRRLTLQRKTVPPEVEGAVLQAIDKLPADRFATAAQFSDALLGRSLTVTTRQAPAATVGTAWRARFYVASIVAALGIAAAVWGFARGHGAQDLVVRRYMSLVDSLRSARIFRAALKSRTKQLVFTFRQSMIREIERAECLDGAVAVWSQWSGYLDRPDSKPLHDFLKRHGIPLIQIHASGHAYVRDLQRLTNALAAKRIVPIHSLAPHRFEELFDRVELHADGEWWEV